MIDYLLPIANHQDILLFLRQSYIRRTKPVVFSVILFSLSAVTSLTWPLFLGVLVSSAEARIHEKHIAAIVPLCVLLLLIQTGLTYSAVLVSRTLGEQVLAELRNEFVKRVLELPMTTIERAGTGDLLSRTTRDIDILSRNIRFTLPEVVHALLSMLFTFAALACVSPLLLPPCLISAPMIVVITRWYFRRAPKAYVEESMAYSRLTEGIAETIDGARTIEALARGASRISRTNADIRNTYQWGRRTLNLRSVWLPGVGLSSFVAIPIVLLAGGWLHSQHLITVGELTTSALYMHQFAEPVNRFSFYSNDFHAGQAALARLLGLPPAASDCHPPAQPDTSPQRRLISSMVNYSYVAGRSVLRAINLDITPGEYIALVGPSGAGKSTLGRVLAGVYMPDSGSVSIGDRALADMSRTELRGQIAMVAQEQHVFAGTLRDNVTIGQPNAMDYEVWSALDAVGATAWVRSLPDGIKTRVGLGGQALSFAECQQLALAQLLLVNPRVAVLDEATAAFEPRTAIDLERLLLAGGRTVISITHRLQVAREADRIVVLCDGMLEQVGSHRSLFAAAGMYAQLWNASASGDIID